MVTIFLLAICCTYINQDKKKAVDPLINISMIGNKIENLVPENRSSASLTEESKKGVPVLLFHQVYKGIGSEDYGNISYEKFIKQLDILKESGYTAITLDDLYSYVTSNKTLPSRPIVLTFDDTNNSDYEIVYPELLKRGYFGVFFTIGKRASQPVWAERLRLMSKKGMEIMDHSMTHKYLGGGPDTRGVRTNIWINNELLYEFVDSRKVIEDITGKKVEFLAWPGDSYTKEMVDYAKESGYKGVFMAKTDQTENVMKNPINKSGYNVYGDNPLYFKRITINGKDSTDTFKDLLKDGVYPRK